MKIYTISGLGADHRVFESLDLPNSELIPLVWIKPKSNETLANYSKRLAEAIDTTEEYGIMGVSFGGFIAVEISKIYKPQTTILISSAEACTDFRQVYRTLGRISILKYMPIKSFALPFFIAKFLFGTKSILLKRILADTDLAFAKWAVFAASNWDNREKISNCLKIGGTKDKLLPPTDDPEIIRIKSGQHFMIVDKAEEVSKEIQKWLDSQS